MTAPRLLEFGCWTFAWDLEIGIWNFFKSQMKVTSTIAFSLALVASVSAEELPRKTKAPRESYPNVDVIYDSVTMPDGKRLRSIITKPRDAKGNCRSLFSPAG